MVERYKGKDPRFRYFYENNKGMSAARNFGICEARGEFIQFLDADDLLETSKLEVHVSYLFHHPETDVVYGDWGYFDFLMTGNIPHPVTPEKAPWRPRESGRGNEILKALLKDNTLVISTPLVRKSLLERCNGFDETLRSHEDWDLWLRCALDGGSFSFLGQEGTRTLIRLHEKNISRNRIVMHETNILVRRKVQPVLHEAELRAINRAGMKEIEVLLAVELLKQGKILSGTQQFLRACFSMAGLAMIFNLAAARCQRP